MVYTDCNKNKVQIERKKKIYIYIMYMSATPPTVWLGPPFSRAMNKRIICHYIIAHHSMFVHIRGSFCGINTK